jgi:site-specific recombinase XerD
MTQVRSLHPRGPNLPNSQAPFPLTVSVENDLYWRGFDLALRAEGKTPKTRRTYQEAIEQLTAFAQGRGMPALPQLTAEHIREFLVSIRDRGCKPNTVLNRHRGLSRFYGWLVKEGELRENPVARIEPPNVPTEIQPHYTPEDVERVLQACDTRRLDGLRDKALLWLLYDTGLRAAELCGLRTADLDWQEQRIKVTRAKGGDERLVGIGDRAMEALSRYLRRRRGDSEWLFPSMRGGAALTVDGLRGLLIRAFERAGVPFKGAHGFRRASAMAYLGAGGQGEDLRVTMGWKSPSMVTRYVRATEQERAAAAHRQFSPGDALKG